MKYLYTPRWCRLWWINGAKTRKQGARGSEDCQPDIAVKYLRAFALQQYFAFVYIGIGAFVDHGAVENMGAFTVPADYFEGIPLAVWFFLVGGFYHLLIFGGRVQFAVYGERGAVYQPEIAAVAFLDLAFDRPGSYFIGGSR